MEGRRKRTLVSGHQVPDRRMALQFYARRMWVEMYGDMKKNGLDLDQTMLRYSLRISRLTLPVAILNVWLDSIGTRTIRSGLRDRVDRNDRRVKPLVGGFDDAGIEYFTLTPHLSSKNTRKIGKRPVNRRVY